jgi:hypothetical protein
VNNTFSKIFSDLNYQNQVLKSLVFGLIALLVISLCAILIFSYRGPTVIGLAENGEVVELSAQLTPKQIEAAIRHYMRLRYNWRKDTLTQQSKLTEAMIADAAIAPFRKAILDLAKFTNGRNVEQRAYARTIDVDIQKKTAFVVADRFNEIESLKAATELRVAFKYILGDRTVSNPWGIYIEKENEGDAR